MPVAIATAAMPPYPAANLRRRDQTTAPFIKKRRHRQKPLANGLDIDHNHHIWYEKTVVNSIFTLSEVDSIISGRALSAEGAGTMDIGLTQLPSFNARSCLNA